MKSPTVQTLGPIGTPSSGLTVAPSVTAGTLEAQHRTVVTIVLLLVLLFLVVEIAGISKNAALVVGLVLFSAALLEGMTHASKFASWARTAIYNPIESGTVSKKTPGTGTSYY